MSRLGISRSSLRHSALLRYVSSFLGGGGPRFWFSVTPEFQRTNYAQVLMGVSVSHLNVFFDFMEEAHEKGESPEEALIDAGIQRLRPVMITVAATVAALFPLALHGGSLWQRLCSAQIGGLVIAASNTLLLVPDLYRIVLDLKIIRWGTSDNGVNVC
jgi:predicted RND superfamily exporter protein